MRSPPPPGGERPAAKRVVRPREDRDRNEVDALHFGEEPRGVGSAGRAVAARG
ncbi:hypothetical protein N8152_02670 [bacterium]|nr:hypothetical protein [bacterium]